MRDLHAKKTRPAGKNRLKKQRKPINYRGFFKKLVRLVGGLLVVALVALTGYEIYGVVARTTFLRLERIEVSELKRLTREEVIGLAGVKPGDDLLSLRLRRIGEQLAKNPWVEKVRVRRYFPHVLAIEVTEREPVAVDPAGSREMLKRARDLIALLTSRTAFRMEDVSEIHCDKGYGFTLFLANGGVPVKLGNDAFDEKLNRLARIYQDLQPQMANLIYIDLDYSDKIIVKKV